MKPKPKPSSQLPTNVRKKPSLLLMSEVVPRDIEWLWYPYIPKGEVTILEGDPGVGKSFITYAIAAAISRGDPLPGEQGKQPKRRTLLVQGEDDPDTAIWHRLHALDADMEQIAILQDFAEVSPEYVRDLEGLVKDFDATIVFIDPYTYFFDHKKDMNKATDVRQVISILRDMARKTGTAVVVVRHLRKSTKNNESSSLLYRGMGSIDLVAAARSLITAEFTDETGEIRIMRHLKASNSGYGATLEFSVDNNRFEWRGEYHNPIEKIVGKDRAMSAAPKRRTAAIKFLVEYLQDGPKPAIEVFKAAQEVGIGEKTLKRAKKGTVQSNNTGDHWEWSLLPEVAGLWENRK